MKLLMDFIILFMALGVAYALMSEGLWGAALMFFNALFAAMIAFNFYEPLAKLLDSTGINWGFSDTLCMLGIFCIALVALRMTTETIAPAMVRFPEPVYHAGRIVFSLAGGGGNRRHHHSGVPRRARSQEDLQRRGSHIQASVWLGSGPHVAGLLSVRDGSRFLEHGQGWPRSVPDVWAGGAGERLRSQGRVAARSL